MIIYKITNKINKKIYIGQTIRHLSVRWGQHLRSKNGCTALKSALKKYGKEKKKKILLINLGICFFTITDATKYCLDLGKKTNKSNISKAANGYLKTSAGYSWKFI